MGPFGTEPLAEGWHDRPGISTIELPSDMDDNDRSEQTAGRAFHYVRSDPIPTNDTAFIERPRGIRARLGSLLNWFLGLMGDRKPSTYSCISPRRPDGTHGPIFNFNSSGWSR